MNLATSTSISPPVWHRRRRRRRRQQQRRPQSPCWRNDSTKSVAAACCFVVALQLRLYASPATSPSPSFAAAAAAADVGVPSYPENCYCDRWGSSNTNGELEYRGEGYQTVHGAGYRGNKNTAYDGSTCLPWQEAIRRLSGESQGNTLGNTIAALSETNVWRNEDVEYASNHSFLTLSNSKDLSFPARALYKSAQPDPLTHGRYPAFGPFQTRSEADAKAHNMCRSVLLTMYQHIYGNDPKGPRPAMNDMEKPFLTKSTFEGFASEGPFCFVERTPELEAAGEPGITSARVSHFLVNYSESRRLSYYRQNTGVMRASCGIPTCTSPPRGCLMPKLGTGYRRLLLANGMFRWWHEYLSLPVPMYWQVGLIGTRAFDRSGRVQYIDEAETEYFHRVYGEPRHLHLMRSIVQTTKGASGFSTTLQDVFTKEWDMSARKVIMQGVSPGRGKGGKGGANSTVRLLLPGAALMGEKRVSGLALFNSLGAASSLRMGETYEASVWLQCATKYGNVTLAVMRYPDPPTTEKPYINAISASSWYTAERGQTANLLLVQTSDGIGHAYVTTTCAGTDEGVWRKLAFRFTPTSDVRETIVQVAMTRASKSDINETVSVDFDDAYLELVAPLEGVEPLSSAECEQTTCGRDPSAIMYRIREEAGVPMSDLNVYGMLKILVASIKCRPASGNPLESTPDEACPFLKDAPLPHLSADDVASHLALMSDDEIVHALGWDGSHPFAKSKDYGRINPGILSEAGIWHMASDMARAVSLVRRWLPVMSQQGLLNVFTTSFYATGFDLDITANRTWPQVPTLNVDDPIECISWEDFPKDLTKPGVVTFLYKEDSAFTTTNTTNSAAGAEDTDKTMTDETTSDDDGRHKKPSSGSLGSSEIAGIAGGLGGCVMLIMISFAVHCRRNRTTKMFDGGNDKSSSQNSDMVGDKDVILTALHPDATSSGSNSSFSNSLGIKTWNERVGRGGQATIYKGTLEDGTTAALKVFHTSENVFREMLVTKSLDHINICKSFGATMYQGRYILVMEYCAFGDLKGVMLNGDLIPNVGVACRLWRDIFSGLAYLKDRGLPHRDIKTTNVLLVYGKGPIRSEMQIHRKEHRRGVVAKLSDFGLAKPEAFVSETSGNLAGTLMYMAPERMQRGARALDYFASDVYSGGLVAWELLNYAQSSKYVSVWNAPGNTVNVSNGTTGETNEGFFYPPPPCGEEQLEVPSDLRPVLMSCLKRESSERLTSGDVVNKIDTHFAF
ncbi:protein kinase [Pycnococcus provasolii]